MPESATFRWRAVASATTSVGMAEESAKGSSTYRTTAAARSAALGSRTSSWCSVSNRCATARAYGRSSCERSAPKPTEKVARRPTFSSRMQATITLESTPPLRKTPRGTSASSRARTASRTSARTRPRSSSRGAGRAAVAVPVVERLLADAVTRQEQTPAARVPHREGEHAAQPVHAGGTVRLPRAQQHLRVAAGGEPAAARLQLAAQVAEVVDLAVEDERDGAVLASHRLLAGDEVDDRQTRHPERGLAVQIAAGVVGAAVLEALQHRVEDLAVAAARADPAGDAAHQRVAPTGAPARLSRRSSTRPAVRSGTKSDARARPRRRRASRCSGSRSTRTSAAASAPSAPTSTTAAPGPATSGSAPRSETITGAPHAIASTAGSPKPSSSEGSTKAAHAL